MEKNFQTHRELVYYTLLEDILHGKILPGEKLVESEIANRFMVSRTPVREAIMQLTKRGVAVHRANVGAVVKKFSSKQIIEFLDVISILEGHAVETVTPGKISDEDIDYLNELDKEMIKICENREYLLYWDKNEKFHNFFIERCENGALRGIVSDMRKQIYRTGMSIPRHSDQFLLDHRMIIDAITKRDAVKAGEIMKNHLINVKNKFIEIFEYIENQSMAI
jgi:DNA-binding GntR family transcriptional regulator